MTIEGTSELVEWPTEDTQATAAVEATWSAEREIYGSSYYLPSMPTPGAIGELPPPVAPPVLPAPLSWGSFGSGPGQFDRPHGLALDGQGRVYVADTENSRVQVFDGTGGGLLGELGGGPGEDPGQFAAPSDVCIDPDGNVYVADAALARVQKFDAGGNLLLSFGEAEVLPDGTAVWDAERNLAVPWTIACSIPDMVFVADASGWRVARFSAAGVFELDFPVGAPSIAPIVAVATTPDGRVLMSDLTNARVAIYDVDGNELGTLIDAAAAGTPSFIPWSIEVGPDGRVYVSDIRNQRLLKLAPDGTLLSEIRLTDIGQGEFFVHGLAVAPDGVLFCTQSNFSYDGAIGSMGYPPLPPERIDRVVAIGPWI